MSGDRVATILMGVILPPCRQGEKRMPSSGQEKNLSRRSFVALSALGTTLPVIGCKIHAGEGWEFLSDAQARTLKAVCDAIVPADDYPSASQAGVLVYIDRQLARHYRRHRDAYRDGLLALDDLSRQRFGGDPASLTPQQMVQLLTEFQHSHRKQFDLFRSHTLEGYYGPPRHGGNRDAASWRMLGVDEPPLRGRAQYDLKKDTAS